MQDNSDMTFYRSELTTRNYNAVADALNNDVRPTDVNLLTELTGATVNTDAVYQDQNYATYCDYDWHPDSTLDADDLYNPGLTECISLSGVRCQRFDVHLDTRRVIQNSV